VPETKTYRGATLDELLPRIRAELGPEAVITRQREGLVGGVGGFFQKKCVEVEAAVLGSGQPLSTMPAQRVVDAYDTGSAARLEATPEELANPVMQKLINQAAPFADHLESAEARFEPIESLPVAEPVPVEEPAHAEFDLDASPAPRDRGFEAARAELVDAGIPAATAEAVVRDAERGMAPFDREATPRDLVRRALARAIKIEHGWKTKRRTIAVVGASGSGKTLAAAKLCHAYASGSQIAVRTLSLEPSSGAYRLGTLTEHLDIGVRVAETPEAAKRAAGRIQGESLIVVDTPPISARDAGAVAALAGLMTEVKPDETHLVVPATMDARAAQALYDALAPSVPINRILITGMDEAPSPAPAVGLSFTLKKPISFVGEGRRPSTGLRPADAATLAEQVLP
jgi:flagellar biosynthesis GTPase FlhF